MKSVCFFLIAVFLLLGGCRTTSDDLASEFFNIGNAYFDVGDYENAAIYYSRAMGSGGKENHERIRYNLALSYLESGQVQEGLEHLRLLLEEDSENLIVLQSIAYALYLLGELNEALLVYDKILSVFEYDESSLYNKSMILYELGSDEALPFMERLYKFHKSEKAALNLGRLYRDSGDDDSFVEVYELAASEYPGNLEIVSGLVDYYEQEGMYTEFLFYTDHLLALDEYQDKAELYFRKAYILLTALADYNNGMESLENSLDAGFGDEEQLKMLLEDAGLVEGERIAVFLERRGFGF